MLSDELRYEFAPSKSKTWQDAWHHARNVTHRSHQAMGICMLGHDALKWLSVVDKSMFSENLWADQCKHFTAGHGVKHKAKAAMPKLEGVAVGVTISTGNISNEQMFVSVYIQVRTILVLRSL